MSDVDGGAAAPAEALPVADARHDEVVHTPNAISTEAPVKPPSIDDALDRAEAKVKAEAAKDAPAPVKSEAKVEPKTEAKAPVKTETKTEPVKSEAKRDEAGKFASDKPAGDPQKAASESATKTDNEPAKPSHTAGEAPARFTETAKAKWASADPEIRGEVSRMERELTQGYQKHKQDAESFNDYRELDDIAKQAGKRGGDVFKEYYQMENFLRKDPVAGMEKLCERLGVSFKDVAAKYLNRSPEEQASQSDVTIRELKQQVSALTEQVGGVTKTFETQRHEATHAEVTKFASDPAHSRFDELSDDIAFFLKTRCPGDLPQAYQLAERLNPGPAPKKDEPASSASIDLVAQTQKGSKSINGAPSNGSIPNARKSSKSLDESLDRAFAALG